MVYGSKIAEEIGWLKLFKLGPRLPYWAITHPILSKIT